MELSNMITTMQDSWRRIRSQCHLTLGQLIELLKQHDSSIAVRIDTDRYPTDTFPGAPESYRGYYSDLAFRPSGDPITASELLKLCASALDATFEGYKGGHFVMGADTPLWLSEWGNSSGLAIVGIEHIGSELVLKTKHIEA